MEIIGDIEPNISLILISQYTPPSLAIYNLPFTERPNNNAVELPLMSHKSRSLDDAFPDSFLFCSSILLLYKIVLVYLFALGLVAPVVRLPKIKCKNS